MHKAIKSDNNNFMIIIIVVVMIIITIMKKSCIFHENNVFLGMLIFYPAVLGIQTNDKQTNNILFQWFVISAHTEKGRRPVWVVLWTSTKTRLVRLVVLVARVARLP